MQREKQGRTTARALRLTVLVAAAIAIWLVSTGPAWAGSRWSDITDAQWLQTYGVTAAQVAKVAQGYDDGSFGPNQTVLRAQFIKMVMSAFGVARATPESPTFTDVPAESCYYSWIEGAAAQGLTPHEPGDAYRPMDPTTREEASLPIAACLAQKAIDVDGTISGRVGMYPSLAAYYAAEGPPLLAGFMDSGDVAAGYAPSEAYLVLLGVAKGSGGGGATCLNPNVPLTRAQAAVLILRAGSRVPKPEPPTVTAVAPAFGTESGGGFVVVAGTGLAQASTVLIGDVALRPGEFQVRSDSEIDIPAAPPGSGSVDVVVVNARGRSAVTGRDVYTYAATPPPGNDAVEAALKNLDVPYTWGGEGPNGFDCSGLAESVYAQLGIALPHHAASQYPMGSSVAAPQLQPGDLVFFGDPIYHVGIYVGDGNMIDAPHTGSWVRLESMAWLDYSNACRVLPPATAANGSQEDPVHEQTDYLLSYSGAWNTTSTSAASGGSFAFADTAGASVTIHFSGTRLAWIAKKSPVYGMAAVSLDGQDPVMVDLYGSDVLWRQNVWDTGPLADGPHTVTISWTGTKCPQATDANIDIDALDVTGSLN